MHSQRVFLRRRWKDTAGPFPRRRKKRWSSWLQGTGDRGHVSASSGRCVRRDQCFHGEHDFYRPAPIVPRIQFGTAAAGPLVSPSAFQPLASGIYSACCQDRFGGEADITFIVKADPARRSRLAVLANVNTWLAYNGWEAPPSTADARRSASSGPTPILPRSRASGLRSLHLTRANCGSSVGWKSRLSAGRLHRPRLSQRVSVQRVSVPGSQHASEYWSVTMYDHLQSFLARGGSLLYLGAMEFTRAPITRVIRPE